MQTVLLVLHLIVAVALVGIILLQKTAQDGSSLAGGGTMGGLFTTRGSANLLTRTTGILATIFICTSLGLAVMAGRAHTPKGALDNLTAVPAAPSTEQQTTPVVPQVPVAK